MGEIDLHRCARTNRGDDLRRAIEAGADVNLKDDFGTTPPHNAIAEKNPAIVALLLEHGADACAQDNEGKTALHYAIEHNLPQVAEMLLRKAPEVVSICDRHGNQPLWTAVFNAKGNYDLVSMLLTFGADARHQNNVNLSPLDIPKRTADMELLRLLEAQLL